MAAWVSLATQDTLKVFGDTIRAARLQRNMTISELAERLGVSHVTVRKVERGDPTVAIGTMFEAAHILRVPLYDDLDHVRDTTRSTLTLLRKRARTPARPSNDF